ncbi:metal-dependent hydrolase [Desulfitobacterium dichloroeliminans]|uniref:metal-dependent hydrolase n=1 Tax=Desulfitobacterium dichloroeliminans TaxID=233055 RepID=UPI00059BD645|nr:metal-dependent hydrolase [Desulfitobacterium dichloroeliminans]
MEVLNIDPITHGLIGAALSSLSGHPMQLNDPIFIGCTLGAMVPDLDIVTHLKGRINYLLKHRGASHSLLALGGMALGLGSLVHFIFPTSAWLTVVFWTLLGTLSHGIADLLNSYGAQLLWPFYKKKFTVNMAMVTDPVIFVLFLSSLIFSLRRPELAIYSTMTVLTVSMIYLLIREIDRLNTRKRLSQAFAVCVGQIKVLPAMYRPFNWSFLLYEEDRVSFGIMQKKEGRILKSLPQWDVEDPWINNALEGELADIFNQFTPYYHVIRKDVGLEAKIQFVDLRYWNKEDFLYKGEVLVCADGKITEERFFSFGNKDSQGIVLEY